MSRRILKKLFFISLLILGYSFAHSQEFSRKKYNFNSDWKFKTEELNGAEAIDYKTSDWTSVTLPYAFNENEAFKKDITQLTTGIVWYRKKFKLPEGAIDKKVFIEFEGIRQGGTIYVNGQKV